MKPVYIINGFLESGKTEFIIYTLEQPYFILKGKTLLILCEEGETVYDKEALQKSNTVLELIEEEEDFTPAALMELDKKYKPERIIIEYNGMWNFKDMKLPWHWDVEQQVTCIDASTFPMYYTNMKSLLAEMVKKSELIIFNRCDGIKDLASYKRNIKAVNRQAEIVFEDSEGEIDEIFEDDLPYSLQDDPIVLDNNSYGIWYIDSMERVERYLDKQVRFTAQVFKPQNFPEDVFVPGRMAMTCCADDMSFLGYVCKYEKAAQLEQRSWVKITAVVKKEYWDDYHGEGPILYAVKVEKTKAPKEEVISFT